MPTLLLCSGFGMAAGGWIAGMIYDHFGFYAPAFATGLGINILNFIVIATLSAAQAPDRFGLKPIASLRPDARGCRRIHRPRQRSRRW